MTRAYYNDVDPAVCLWLEELIRQGHLPPGDVDCRSILEVKPDDLAGYDQCHFFAGIGGWAHALDLAGVPRDMPLWTGSAPCQPFSTAGMRKGYEDERHLAPVWLSLIAERRPPVVLGEQVASPAARTWLADLRAEMEALGYRVAAADLCAASVGAPHIRQRLFFGAALEGLADASDGRWGRRAYGRGDVLDGPEGRPEDGGVVEPRLAGGGLADADLGAGAQGSAVVRGGAGRGDAVERAGPRGNGVSQWVADPSGEGLPPRQREAVQRTGRGQEGRAAQQRGRPSDGLADANRSVAEQSARAGQRPRSETYGGKDGEPDRRMSLRRLADADGGESRQSGDVQACGQLGRQQEDGGAGREGLSGTQHLDATDGVDDGRRPGEADGFWDAPDWLFCADGKWRPVEPGSFPLADGLPARVVRLRGYGNAIVPQGAQAFIESFLDALEETTYAEG